MNFIEAITKCLTDRGLDDAKAAAIMEVVLADTEAMPTMQGRWRDQVDDYFPGLVNIIFANVKPIAYKWICENKPKAWYRVDFSPGIVGLKGAELEAYITKYQREVQRLHEVD